MDTKQLITFITFSEEKSYLRASMKLNYAASTLSEHILALENELGVKLVESRGKRTALTKGGEKFLVYARKMMDLYNTACKDMSSMNGIKGNLRVMTVESLGLYSMATVFVKFMTKYPDVTLSINIGNCNSIYDRLRNDEIDVAYLYDMGPVEQDDIETCVLFREPLCFVVSPNHYLARKDTISPKDFQHQVFILAQKDCYYYDRFDKMLADNQVVLRNKLQLDSGNLIKKYVSSGYGISLLPYSVVREDAEAGTLKILNWTGEPWEACAQILTLKKEWIMPSVPALIQVSKDLAATVR
ncbi:MAG: LysR family transcriptional regulator [Clostridiales bacterium]|nr:LysR family transcriptional regulator [Clostridiales bacterium]